MKVRFFLMTNIIVYARERKREKRVYCHCSIYKCITHLIPSFPNTDTTKIKKHNRLNTQFQNLQNIFV